MFAELSGDFNPLHMDSIVARRLLFGTQVVHGIHALLWALDCNFKDHEGKVALSSIKSTFLKPIRVGDSVNLCIEEETKSEVILQLRHGTSTMSRVKLSWQKHEPEEGKVDLSLKAAQQKTPKERSEDEIEHAAGEIGLYLKSEEVAKSFPNLIRCLPSGQIATIMATTRLVGMECPGLHSIYSELELVVSNERKEQPLRYEVTHFNKGFGLVAMTVHGLGMAGQIKAFIRPKPQEQETCANLKEAVIGNEFSGQRALVVGGSRGLGEAVAKFLALGGAEVAITYYQGSDDALRVATEITSAGCCVESLSLDVLDENPRLIEKLTPNWKPTHLYYFATPFIALGTRGQFSQELFEKFCNHYVDGFQRIVRQLSHFELEGVFFPSSVFVQERQPGMDEYAEAKKAGETICSSLELEFPNTIFLKPRLPKMATDQTVGLTPSRQVNPKVVLLELLRSFRDSSPLSHTANHHDRTFSDN